MLARLTAFLTGLIGGFIAVACLGFIIVVILDPDFTSGKLNPKPLSYAQQGDLLRAAMYMFVFAAASLVIAIYVWRGKRFVGKTFALGILDGFCAGFLFAGICLIKIRGG